MARSFILSVDLVSSLSVMVSTGSAKLVSHLSTMKSSTQNHGGFWWEQKLKKMSHTHVGLDGLFFPDSFVTERVSFNVGMQVEIFKKKGKHKAYVHDLSDGYGEVEEDSWTNPFQEGENDARALPPPSLRPLASIHEGSITRSRPQQLQRRVGKHVASAEVHSRRIPSVPESVGVHSRRIPSVPEDVLQSA